MAVPQAGSEDEFPNDFDCEQLKPQASWYLHWQQPDFVSDYGSILKSTSMTLSLVIALALVGFVIGTIGAAGGSAGDAGRSRRVCARDDS